MKILYIKSILIIIIINLIKWANFDYFILVCISQIMIGKIIYKYSHDLIVIGGGPGGYVAAIKAA